MSYHQLSQQERYIITALKVSGASIAQIARQLGRSRCTIYRELSRNRKPSDRKYRAEPAHSYATARRRRVRRGFRLSPECWRSIIGYLKVEWSPEQISNHLRIVGSFTVSHQTIYHYIHDDRKHGGVLFRCLRILPKVRKKRYKSHDSRGILPGKRHISERPPEVQTRTTLGHWEGDTVMGTDPHNCLLTLVERKSGFAIIRKLSSRSASTVTEALLAAIQEHQGRFKTITFDNGTEFHSYKILEQHFSLTCFFATPYHSWERGSNENLNGLVRQYIPKGVSMRSVNQAYCDAVSLRLNSRPRKRHGYRTPAEVYCAH